MTDIFRGFRGIWPRVGEGVFVADTARVIGDVELGADVSIWYGSVLRGDVGSIRVGARSNIQDLSVLHMSSGISNTVIGEEVTIGHNVVIHGALIGMGAILLDNCEIGAEALVAAGTVIPVGSKIPARTLVVGTPGKVVRELQESEWQQGRLLAARYVEVAKAHRQS